MRTTRKRAKVEAAQEMRVVNNQSKFLHLPHNLIHRLAEVRCRETTPETLHSTHHTSNAFENVAATEPCTLNKNARSLTVSLLL